VLKRLANLEEEKARALCRRVAGRTGGMNTIAYQVHRGAINQLVFVVLLQSEPSKASEKQKARRPMSRQKSRAKQSQSAIAISIAASPRQKTDLRKVLI
jgi:hypothetical protein